MSKKAKLLNDYERMVPEFHNHSLTYAEHITRYQSALPLVKGKVVLDIACGSGYGTQLLSLHAKKVYGVDVDGTSVQYATQNYGAPNIEYRVGNGESIPLDDNSVDVVTTFETIEHIPDYKKFIREIKRVLKPNGIALVSTPNDLEFAEGNHFHLHEFVYKELINLIKKDFKHVDPYFQGTWKYVAVGPKEIFETEGIVKIPTFNLSPKKDEEYLYFYLVCSNRDIKEKIEPIAALGEHYSDRYYLSAHAQAEKTINNITEENEGLKSYLKTANQQALEMQLGRDKLLGEIVAIKKSKAYKAAQRLSSLKGTIFHDNK